MAGIERRARRAARKAAEAAEALSPEEASAIEAARVHHPGTCGPCVDCKQAARQWKLNLARLA
jgi:hypothetical protein